MAVTNRSGWQLGAVGSDLQAIQNWLSRLERQWLAQLAQPNTAALLRMRGLRTDEIPAGSDDPNSAPDLILIAASDPDQGAIRARLIACGWAFTVIDDWQDAGLQQAEDLLAMRLRPSIQPSSGLFSRLQARENISRQWRWTCDSCDDPDCEHALRQAVRDGSSVQAR
jgi:hypothetical protein